MQPARRPIVAVALAAGLCAWALRPVQAATVDARSRAAWYCAHDVVAYLYALGLEVRWSRADPQTKEGLEKYLWLYSEHVISPGDSEWGSGYELRPGERMVQYLILWRAPLDVVYDSANRIQAIFTSYE